MKHVLVTGGTGYLALHVIQLLLQRGYTVTTTVRPTVSEERLKSLKLLSSNYPNKLHLQQLDLLQPVSDSIIGQALDGIIHCASPVPMKFEDGWKEVIAPALQGTEELLKAAVRNNISTFIYTSSIVTVHPVPGQPGRVYDEGCWNESLYRESLGKKDYYYYSKVEAERLVWKYQAEHHNMRMVSLNPSLMVGPYAVMRPAELGLSGQYWENLFERRVPRVETVGVGVVDIRDVAEAHVLALERPEVRGRFCLNATSVSLDQLYDLVQQIDPAASTATGVEGLKTRFSNHGQGFTINTSKSEKELGIRYRPLRESLQDMMKQLKE